MVVNVSGHHVAVTPALKEHVEKNMRKLEQHFDNITNVHVVLSMENKFHHKAKAEIHSPKAVIVAEAATDNMHVSIDALTHKLDTQILEHKAKMKQHHPHQAQGLDLE